MNYSNNQMMYQRPMQGMANQLANQGRYGDSMMVHMNPVEVAGLASLSPTGSLTRNPMTGQPEAFLLPLIAPIFGGFAGGAIAGGLGLGSLGTLATKAIATEGISALAGGRSFDPLRALASGATQAGLSEVVDTATETLTPEIADASKALSEAEALQSNLTRNVGIVPEIDERLAMLNAPAYDADIRNLADFTQPAETNLTKGMVGANVPVTTSTVLDNLPDPNVGSVAYKQQVLDKALAKANPMATFQADPGAFVKELGKGLTDPKSLAMIGVGEGTIGQIDMQERFEKQQREMMEEQEQKRLDAYNQMNRAKKLASEEFGTPYLPINPNDNPYAETPQTQTYYSYGGGITSVDPSGYMRSRRNLENMGVEPIQMFPGGQFPDLDYLTGLRGGATGTPSEIQNKIRPPRVVTEEELATEAADLVAQGKDPRAGFRSEIQYFREPLPDPEDPEDPTPDPEPDLPFDPAPFVGYNPKGGMIPQGGRKGTNFYREQQQNKTMPAGVTSGAMSSMAGLPQLMGLQGAQNLPMSTASPVESQTQDYSDLVMGDDSVTNLEEIRKRIAAMNLPFAEGGKTDFPDYNKDGEITQADILMGRGVIEKQEGGATSQDPLVNATVQALMGQAAPEEMDKIIEAFVAKYGVEAFQQLREQVLQSIVPNAQTEGQIQGQGGGMEDNIDGMIGADQPVAVSPNEYIVAADVVSGLGDGNSDEGAAILDEMMDRVRMTRTGTKQQPQPLDQRQVMPA